MNAPRLTQAQILDCIETALLRAIAYFAPGTHTPIGSNAPARFVGVCTRLGYNHHLLSVRTTLDWGFEYSHRFELSFGISYEVTIGFDWDEKEKRVKPSIRICWGTTGDRTLANAVASAKLQLEASERACMVECTLLDALRSLHHERVTYAAWKEARTTFRKRLEQQNDNAGETYRAELEGK